MFIVVEGPDRAGKSTLAQALAADLELPHLHFGVPPTLDAADHFLTGLRAHAGGAVVDRLHLSNYAYNGVLGGGVLLAEEWAALDSYLARRWSWLLLLVDHPFRIEERLRQEGPSEASGLTRPQLGTICGRFNAAFSASNIPHKGMYQLPQFIGPVSGERTEQYQSLVASLRERLGGGKNG